MLPLQRQTQPAVQLHAAPIQVPVTPGSGVSLGLIAPPQTPVGLESLETTPLGNPLGGLVLPALANPQQALYGCSYPHPLPPLSSQTCRP